MTTEEPTWYERYLEAWNSLDLEAVMAWFTDDVFYEDTTIAHSATGHEQARRFVRASFSNVPDARFEFVRGHDADDVYVIEWIMHPMGIRGVSTGRMRDGLIFENRDYWNGARYTVPNT